MKRVLISAVLALLFVILMTGLGLTALPHAETSGNFITSSTTFHSVTEDKFNTIIDPSSAVTYTGTLVVHRGDSADFKGVEIFTGLVQGIPGTLTFKLEGNSNRYQAIQINNSITSGTGELAGLHGELAKAEIIKDNGIIGTYTGQISHQ